MSGQPGDKAALQDSITIPWNATADDIKVAILASSNFYKYDQTNHLTAGPAGFHTLFDSGGGLGITGNEARAANQSSPAALAILPFNSARLRPEQLELTIPG